MVAPRYVADVNVGLLLARLVLGAASCQRSKGQSLPMYLVAAAVDLIAAAVGVQTEVARCSLKPPNIRSTVCTPEGKSTCPPPPPPPGHRIGKPDQAQLSQGAPGSLSQVVPPRVLVATDDDPSRCSRRNESGSPGLGW